MKVLRNEDGFSTILLALMVLLVCTALGIASLQTSQREIKSVNKLGLSMQAFYSAESGVQLAIAKLNSGSWTEFNTVVSNMNSNILPTDALRLTSSDFGLNINFETVVEFLGSDPLCYGDIDEDFDYEQHPFSDFSSAGKVAGKDFWPVLKITSRGWHGNNPKDRFKYAERNVQILVKLEPTFQFPQAALTLNGDLTGHGEPNAIVGEGHPDITEHCMVADIVGTNTTVNNYDGDTDICDPDGDNVWEVCTDEPEIIDNSEPYPVNQAVAILRTMATMVTISNGVHLNGEPTDIYYHEGNAGPINNLEGQGVLVVNGDLTIGGNIDWDGLILVTGNLVTNGGGSDTNYIHGCVIVGGDVTLNGNPDIYFDCDFLINLWESAGAYHMKWWKEIKGRITL